jgi:hypothetical protein
LGGKAVYTRVDDTGAGSFFVKPLQNSMIIDRKASISSRILHFYTDQRAGYAGVLG